MSESSSGSGGGGGCGCVGLIVFILVVWALWFGLPVGDKTWNIDIFPPRIWDMNAEVATDAPTDSTVQPTAKVSATDTPTADSTSW